MRFRLVEAPTREWPPSSETLDAFAKQKSLEQQKNFLAKHILPQPKFRDLFGIRPIIIHSIMIAGLDPKRNKFLDFICNIPFKMTDSKIYKEKMQYLYESYNNKRIDIKSTALIPILYNESLWKRSLEDFRYTLNAFNMFSQPRLYKAYLKDTDKTKRVTINAFMNGKEIKDAGIDGKAGDTIYNQIEEWAKDNEYTFDEIQSNKQKAEKEERKNKIGNRNTSGNGISVNGNGRENKVEWSYEYFEDVLEKVYANINKFETKLSSKNDYLERAFATFKLSELSPQETDNKVYKKTLSSIKDGDVNKFGDPHNVDEPIYLSVRDANNSMFGAYVFHKFIPLDDSSMNYYKQLAKKNLGNLKRHLNNVNPNNDHDVNEHLQSIVDALGVLSDIPQK